MHTLSDAERKSFYRKEYSSQSRFQRAFGKDRVDMEIGEFGALFRSEVMRLLAAKGAVSGKETLEELHQSLPQDMKDYNFNDGVNSITTLLYDTDDAFTAIYHRFIREVVSRHFPYPFWFQATPTMRLHCPGGKHSDHYPRYHSDISYGHPPQEINIWIPLTQAKAPQQHGFRCMDVEASRTVLEAFDYDFGPFIDRAIHDKPFDYELNEKAPQVETPLGKMAAFDARCIHTGEPLEQHTRASIDIRIIAVDDFNALPVEYQGTGRRRILYIPGECYHALSSDRL